MNAGECWGRKGDFCAVVHVTAGILAQVGFKKALAVKLSQPRGRLGLYACLIGSNPRRLKGDKGNDLPRNGLYCHTALCGIFFGELPYSVWLRHSLASQLDRETLCAPWPRYCAIRCSYTVNMVLAAVPCKSCAANVN